MRKPKLVFASELDLFAEAIQLSPEEEQLLIDCATLDGCPAGLIPLVTGIGRSTLLEKYDAVLSLRTDGYDAATIAAAIGWSKEAVEALYRFDGLNSILRTAWREGKLSDLQARACAKLAPVYQQDLAAKIADGEVVTGQTIAAVKNARRAATLWALPEELFDVPGTPTTQMAPAADPVYTAALALVQALDASAYGLPTGQWAVFLQLRAALVAAGMYEVPNEL